MPATLSAPAIRHEQLQFDFDAAPISSFAMGATQVPARKRTATLRPDRKELVQEELDQLNHQELQLRSRAGRCMPAAMIARDLTSARAAAHQAVASNASPAQQISKSNRRGQGEVKLGAVMIQLLKRYGITDEEIEAGVAEYAARRCHA